MKNRFLFLIVFTLTLHSFLFAQDKIELKIASEANTIKSTYPVHAGEYIERFNKAVGFDPNSQISKTDVSVQKTSAWDFQIGTTKSWKASDFESNQYYNVSSTCRAVGTNCYIFVEDAIWGNTVTQAGVEAVVNAFDNQTPANSNKGIYQTCVEVFGSPADDDGDPKIIILILDIKDGYSGSGGYVAGYYHSVNQTKPGTTPDPNSNSAEIYYLDGKQTNLTTPSGLNTAMSTTAHEFQHMIAFNQFVRIGVSEITFFNECLSLTSEIICGYSIFNQSLYANESNIYVTDWRKDDNTKVLNDYSRAARLGLYLLEQFGTQFFTRYRQNKNPDMSGFNQSVVEAGTGRTIGSVFADWFLANYLNDKNVNERYGYNYQTPTQVNATEHIIPDVSITNNVYNYGSQYVAFTGGSNLNIKFYNFGRNLLKVKAIKYYNGSSSVVEDVPTDNTNYSVPELGSTVSKVVFAVYYIDTGTPLWNDPKIGPYNFSYTASGTANNAPIEIAYENTPPVGVYVLSVGDTCAVRFDGKPGMKLDSIRVALRNTAEIEGGIWRAGSSSFTNGRLSPKFFVSGITTPPSPYPNPYTNWVTIDTRSYNIDATNSFVAAFVINGIYENSSSPYNRVMHTNISGSSAYHSYTYLNDPSSGTPNWYFLGDGSNISLYLIRAYVSSGTTDNKEVIELLPSAFTLEQNYPNPFNPSTIISYQIPAQSKVQIKIFDALGREIRSLIDEEKSAGKYSIAWDGADNYGKQVASGVYFYSIISKEFVQTKKMVLMR